MKPLTRTQGLKVTKAKKRPQIKHNTGSKIPNKAE